MCVHVCLRDTWDPFQLNPYGAEEESKRRCFQMAQYLVAVIVGLAVLASAVIAKVGLSVCLSIHLFKVSHVFIIGVEAMRKKLYHRVPGTKWEAPSLKSFWCSHFIFLIFFDKRQSKAFSHTSRLKNIHRSAITLGQHGLCRCCSFIVLFSHTVYCCICITGSVVYTTLTGSSVWSCSCV